MHYINHSFNYLFTCSLASQRQYVVLWSDIRLSNHTPSFTTRARVSIPLTWQTQAIKASCLIVDLVRQAQHPHIISCHVFRKTKLSECIRDLEFIAANQRHQQQLLKVIACTSSPLLPRQCTVHLCLTWQPAVQSRVDAFHAISYLCAHADSLLAHALECPLLLIVYSKR